MKKAIKWLILVLLVISAFSVCLLLKRHEGRFSMHKWHEGDAEKVIGDVMENHVYPGVSVSEAERLLGSGIELTDEKAASLFGSLGIPDEDGLDVFLYKIRESNGRCLYFAVVHNQQNVVKTVLVDSLD